MEKNKKKSNDPSDHYGNLRSGEAYEYAKGIHAGGRDLPKGIDLCTDPSGNHLFGTRYTHAVFHEESFEEAPGKNAKVKLSTDVSVKKFAEVLEKNGLIEDAGILEFQLKIKKFEGPVKAGIYELNTSMTPSEILKVLRSAEEGQ